MNLTASRSLISFMQDANNTTFRVTPIGGVDSAGTNTPRSLGDLDLKCPGAGRLRYPLRNLNSAFAMFAPRRFSCSVLIIEYRNAATKFHLVAEYAAKRTSPTRLRTSRHECMGLFVRSSLLGTWISEVWRKLLVPLRFSCRFANAYIDGIRIYSRFFSDQELLLLRDELSLTGTDLTAPGFAITLHL
jgi:hypothetical protein